MIVRVSRKGKAMRLYTSLIGLVLGSAVGFSQEPPKLQTTLTGHTSSVMAVAFSPDGKTLASASSDKSIKLWDATTGKNTATFEGHTHSVNAVAFSPDGRTLASGSADKSIKQWDAATGKSTATLEGHTSFIFAVAFSPDGKTLASASDSIKLWDVATGMNIATYGKDLKGFVAFSPDGKTLASSSTDKSIHLWDVKTGKETATFAGTTRGFLAVAFNPDGKTFASGGSGAPEENLNLWDVPTGKITKALWGHMGSFGQESVSSVVFSPDGKTLASGGQTIQLWEVATGKRLAMVEGHEVRGSRSLAFSPDGKTLAAGGLLKDYTIKLWDVAAVADRPPAGDDKSPKADRGGEINEALFAKYRGAEPIPDGLKKAYTAFVKAATDKEAREFVVDSFLLPHAVTVTYERRAEKERLDRLRGDNLNAPFMKEDFVPEVWVFRKDAEGCYLVRTPTTGMFWVETKAGGWRIYRYFDKPIR